MKVTKNITIDLNNPRRHVVHLMESGNQREIVLTLLKDGMPFDVSEGIGAATLVKGVGYIKANGVPGYYDWTSTDMAAVEAVTGSTNKWTVRLDEHATDVPGFAQIFVKFSLASGETLYSFPITLDVIRTSGGTTDPDKPYYHSTSFLLAGAQAAKTPAMTFPVGVDGDGKLWAEGGWSAEAKEALIACFEQVAWKTTYGQTYLSALETALYPEVHLVSITAAYDQDRPILDTDSLDLVRLDLVVTANYSDGTSETLADDAYTLTGTLTVGTSTITVGYEGKTAEISVVVTSGMVCDILTLDGIKNTRDGHDSSSTVWEDLSGNENDFTVIDGSAPLWGDKYAGFDATNRALGLTKDLFGTDKSVSVELVLKITGNGSAQDGNTYLGGIFTSREYDTSANGIDLYSYNANGMSAYWKSNNLGYTGSIGDKIVYLCFVFDGSSCTKYLNGSSVSTNTVNDWNASTTRRSDFRIGRTTGYAKNFYPSANIYRIGIHSSAFSAQDVADRYAFYASRFGITE